MREAVILFWDFCAVVGFITILSVVTLVASWWLDGLRCK